MDAQPGCGPENVLPLCPFRIFLGLRRGRIPRGAALPLLALNYVQNPERALANAFFFVVVVPLAVIALPRVPLGVALAAVITNGLVTAKVGTSSEWLPSSSLVLLPAAVCMAWVF